MRVFLSSSLGVVIGREKEGRKGGREVLVDGSSFAFCSSASR